MNEQPAIDRGRVRAGSAAFVPDHGSAAPIVKATAAAERDHQNNDDEESLG
jgi:hypothetical protein